MIPIRYFLLLTLLLLFISCGEVYVEQEDCKVIKIYSCEHDEIVDNEVKYNEKMI